jgi:hypothetical protein
MLLRVHKKLSFSLSSYIKRILKCTIAQKNDRRAVQFYEHLDELFCCCFTSIVFSIPVSCIISLDWSKKTSYQEIKIKNRKLHTQNFPFAAFANASRRRKKEGNMKLADFLFAFYFPTCLA